MSSQISPKLQRAIDRLRKIDPAKPALDRTTVEKALRAQLAALELPDRPIVWVTDAQEGYARLIAAAKDTASAFARDMAPFDARAAAQDAARYPDRAAAWDATRAALKDCARAAVRQAGRNHARHAAWAGARDPAWDATWDAANKATKAAAKAATKHAAWIAAAKAAYNVAEPAAKYAAYNAARHAAANAAGHAAGAATWSALRAAAWDAATWDAALRTAAGDTALRSAAWDAARNAAAGDAASDAATDAAWDAAGVAGLVVASDATSAYIDLSRLTVFEHPTQHKLVGICLPMIDAFEAGLFLYWMMPTKIVCVPAPALSLRDDRLHNEFGPAVAWPSPDRGPGQASERYWFWNGTNVPQRLIEDIKREPDAELRRRMVERFAYERYLRAASAQKIREDETGILWHCLQKRTHGQMPNSEEEIDEIFVVEVFDAPLQPDGTRKRFFLPVPWTCQTAKEAVEWATD